MAKPTERSSQVRDHLLRDWPFLREGALPAATWYGSPPQDPALFPDVSPTRGYLLPVPPPSGTRIQASSVPILVGQPQGRPVRVDLLLTDPRLRPAVPPAILVHAAVRIGRPPPSGVPPLPWFAAVPSDIGVRNGFANQGHMNLVGFTGRSTLHAIGRRGGDTTGASRLPWISEPLVLAGSEPAITDYLRSADFLERYHEWEAVCGTPIGRSGPMRPVITGEADRFTAVGGFGPDAPVAAASQILRNVLSITASLEQASRGAAVASEPWTTLTFRDPPNSLPDVRHAFLCPACGQPELLQCRKDLESRSVLWRTLRCDRDLFLPERVG